MPKAQPVDDDRQSPLRENFETDVAPDLIDAEKPPKSRGVETSICSLPDKDE